MVNDIQRTGKHISFKRIFGITLKSFIILQEMVKTLHRKFLSSKVKNQNLKWFSQAYFIVTL